MAVFVILVMVTQVPLRAGESMVQLYAVDGTKVFISQDASVGWAFMMMEAGNVPKLDLAQIYPAGPDAAYRPLERQEAWWNYWCGIVGQAGQNSLADLKINPAALKGISAYLTLLGSQTKAGQGQDLAATATQALALPPGTTHHGWAISIDFYFDKGDYAYNWMVKNGPRFGWMPSSLPWQFDYRHTHKGQGAIPGNDPAKPTAVEKLQLGKVKVGMRYEELMKTLSNPDSVTGEKADPVQTLNYPGMSVVVAFGRAQNIAVDSEAYPTPLGLAVGDTRAEVQRLYGRPQLGGAADAAWFYTMGADPFNLVVLFDGDQVTGLMVHVTEI